MIIRALAAYEKTSKYKYVSLKSSFFAKILIPKGKKYVKVADRKKISVFSFVFYILFFILAVGLLVLLIMPDIPCEPFLARFGNRGGGAIKWEVNTLNEKLIVLLPYIFMLVEIITYFSMHIPLLIKEKSNSKKTMFGIYAILLMFVGFLAFFVFLLF